MLLRNTHGFKGITDQDFVLCLVRTSVPMGLILGAQGKQSDNCNIDSEANDNFYSYLECNKQLQQLKKERPLTYIVNCDMCGNNHQHDVTCDLAEVLRWHIAIG